VPLDDLLAAGADADRRHPCTKELLDPQDVGAGVGGSSSNERQVEMSCDQPGRFS
jgi:hypothetical protein